MFTNNKLVMDSLAEAVKKVMKDEESGLRMAAHAAHKDGKKMFTFQGKTYPVKVQGEQVSYGSAVLSQEKHGDKDKEEDCVTEPRAKEIAKKEVKGHEKERHGPKGDVAQHLKKMHKEETFKDRLVESAYGKKSPMIDEDDSKMTPEQKKKKEKIVLSMKDKEKEFKAKYGKNWKSVMYATATKLAMKEDFDPEELEEAKGETEQEFKARQTRLAAAHDATKQNPERLKRLMKIPGYGAAMSLAQKTTKEEVEQVDEVSKSEVDKFHKKLDTLVHSSFGKSSKEKKMKEEVEQIDELGKQTLKRYVKGATDDVSYHSFAAGGLKSSDPNRLQHDKKAMKRQAGVEKAVDRLSKEEVEQIDEVGDTEKGRQALTKLIGARVQDPKGKHGLEGVKRALKRLGPARRLRGEEVEELDENDYMKSVRRRVAKNDAERYTQYAKQDAEKGHTAGAKLYSKAAKHSMKKANEEYEQIDEKNKSHTHAAHYENDKGEWVGMNLLVAKDDNDAIRQAHEKCKEGCRLSRVERHIPVKESTDDDVPFVPDKKKSSANVTDKSGAHHTAMSRVRHLAKQALEKQKKMKKEMIGKDGMTSEETDNESD